MKTAVLLLSLTLSAVGYLHSAPPTPPAPPEAPETPEAPSAPTWEKKMEPRVFLGVETSSLPQVLSSQLNLPEGFGLVVDYVVPDSPAAAAKLEKNDILKLLDDQKLVDPDQLATLIRGSQDGQDVTLTVLRKGQEMKVTAKLAKKDLPMMGHGGWMQGIQEMHDFNMGDMPEIKNLRDTIQKKVRGELRKFNLADTQLICDDDSGSLEIRTKDGQKTLKATKPDGTVIFQGPINSPEERKAIPAEVLPRLEKLEKEKVPTPPAPPAAPALPEQPKSPQTSTVFHSHRTRYAISLIFGGNQNRSLSLKWGRLFSLNVV